LRALILKSSPDRHAVGKSERERERSVVGMCCVKGSREGKGVSS